MAPSFSRLASETKRLVSLLVLLQLLTKKSSHIFSTHFQLKFKMVDQCKNCGAGEFDVDPTRGVTVCVECGVVQAERNIVNEVQFMENSRGQSSAIGQFIAHDSSAPRPLFRGCQGTFSKESREITLQKAKKKIEALTTSLGLSKHVDSIANNHFKLSLSHGLCRGRKSAHVIGACVYIACRQERTPHMLIDVSDAAQVDVYELGRTYLRITTALKINNLTSIDPCIYILRFSHKLQFGDKTHDVSNTASRLVVRMKKDWMDIGRRPSGICGAALVIAARFHNFNRTIQDVIKVVKVHESTIRKRLTEFGSTPSSELTLDEFMDKDLDQSEDPPAFKAARRREEEQLQKLMDQEKDLTNEFTDIQLEIERILSERKKKLKGLWAAASTATDDGQVDLSQENSDAAQFITEATMHSIQECLGRDAATLNEHITQHEILPTTASMGLNQTIEESMEIRPSEPEPPESGILDLEGIDDEEIDSYILTDREKEMKTNLWMNLNREFLEEQEKKKEQERLEEEQRVKEGKPAKKRKPYRKKGKSDPPANTAGEAMERLIKAKKLSNKIDYSVLKNLNGESDHVGETRSLASSRSSKTSKKSTSSHPPLPEKLREIMQSLTGERTPQEAINKDLNLNVDFDDDDEDEPELKKQKVEVTTDSPAAEEEEEYYEEREVEEEDEEEEEEDDGLRSLLGEREDDDEYYD
ncbi:Brf1 TBP-binding domain [Trinorchestia longiramus]|nr:Brf1 TBP-binding domain [Trinorchestia longiramus]